MTTRVYYSAWQLQCCGDAFAVGDSVAWTVLPMAADRPELGAEGSGVDWAEEHHPARGIRVTPLSGVVTWIRRLSDTGAEDVATADGVGPGLTGYVVALD